MGDTSGGTIKIPPDLSWAEDNNISNQKNNEDNQHSNEGEGTPHSNTNQNQIITDNTNSIKQKVTNKYTVKSTFNEYKVHIEKKDGSPVSNLKIGQIISTILKKTNVISLKRVSRKTVILCLNDIHSANELIGHSHLTENGLNAFIPWYYTCRAAVIRGVDLEYDNDTIKTNIDSRQFKVRDVVRLNKTVYNDGTVSFVPSQSVKIFFEGQELPRYVYIWYNSFDCEPFVRKIRQCLKCLRFGHVSRACKGSDRCIKCAGNNHIATNCASSVQRCANCNQNHSANSKDCPEKRRQQKINESMGLYNMSFHEANIACPRTYDNRKLYSVVTENKFSLLDNIDEFPNINAKKDNDIPVYVPQPKFSYARENKSSMKKKGMKHSEKRQRDYSPEIIGNETVEKVIRMDDSQRLALARRANNLDKSKETIRKIQESQREKESGQQVMKKHNITDEESNMEVESDDEYKSERKPRRGRRKGSRSSN